MNRDRFDKALEIIKTQINRSPANILLNLMVTFIYGKFGLNDLHLSDKYKRVTERLFLRSVGLIPSNK